MTLPRRRPSKSAHARLVASALRLEELDEDTPAARLVIGELAMTTRRLRGRGPEPGQIAQAEQRGYGPITVKHSRDSGATWEELALELRGWAKLMRAIAGLKDGGLVTAVYHYGEAIDVVSAKVFAGSGAAGYWAYRYVFAKRVWKVRFHDPSGAAYGA